MENFAFEHVSDGFEAAMRVIWEASGEFDVEMIHCDEWVELGKVGGAYYSVDFGLIAFRDDWWGEDFLNRF